MGLYLLDYGAGNVQSLANTLTKLGHDFRWISSPADFEKATVSHRSRSLPTLLPSSSQLTRLCRVSYSLESVPLAAPSMGLYHAASSTPFANTSRRENHTSGSASACKSSSVRPSSPPCPKA